MTEDFLHFIWKYGFFERSGLMADNGEDIQVIALGEHNTNAGPDFLNARIKIGNTIWAGNVEIHLLSSDWTDHGHYLDKAYDNVILHVVYRNNQPVARSSGEIIPTIEILFDHRLYDNYRNLLNHKGLLPCHPKISRTDPFLLDLWLSSLVVERLKLKSDYIDALLIRQKNNWEEAFYIGLARSFGFGLNAAPFEMLANSISLRDLSRCRNSLFQVEAILMGQAGFISETGLFAGYYADLHKEYNHLKKKFGLKPMEKHLWKFLRLRPVNFPTIRIAQFAALLTKTEGLFSRILTCKDFHELREFFNIRTSSFWDTHYTFETSSPPKIKNIGHDAFEVLLINAVIPFLFVHGLRSGQEALKERALEWLGRLPPEKNQVVNRWKKTGIIAKSAFYSQGMLQLTNNYCNRKRCLACSVGTSIISSATDL